MVSMRTVYLVQFVDALRRGDASGDAFALTLLEKGRVTIRSTISGESHGVNDPLPVLHIAVRFVRERVVRALLRLGADINAAHYSPTNGLYRIPTGEAIIMGCASGLALCHTVGASMSVVARRQDGDGSGTTDDSAIAAAIREKQSTCLAFLLEKVYPQKPIKLDRWEMTGLCVCALHGGPVKALFKVLENEGFNFKSLKDVEFNEEHPDGMMMLNDVLLTSAQKSGDTDLLRYIVKDLGVVSTTGKLDASKAILDFAASALVPPTGEEVPLVK